MWDSPTLGMQINFFFFPFLHRKPLVLVLWESKSKINPFSNRRPSFSDLSDIINSQGVIRCGAQTSLTHQQRIKTIVGVWKEVANGRDADPRPTKGSPAWSKPGRDKTHEGGTRQRFNHRLWVINGDISQAASQTQYSIFIMTDSFKKNTEYRTLCARPPGGQVALARCAAH